MATLKQRLHRKSDSGTYDVVHLETSSDIVDFDGQTVHDALSSALSLANAANQEIPNLKSSVSEGKRQVASAITDKGVSTASDASFSTMAANIRKIDKIMTGTPALNKDFTYSGQCQVIDDSTEAYNEWRIKFLTSGTLKFTANIAVDIFLVGGGGGGAGHATNSNNNSLLCTGGGGGGYTKTLNNITLNKNVSYSIVIGNGGVKGDKSVKGNIHGNYGNPGGNTSISEIAEGSVAGGIGGGGPIPTGDSSSMPLKGGDGGSGGGSGFFGIVSSATRSTRATNGNNGTKCNANGTVMNWGTPGTGQGSTTKEFGDNGATSYSMGGASGGSDASYGVVSNSGNGGDGRCHRGDNIYGSGSNVDGSSGVLIIRKHKT